MLPGLLYAIATIMDLTTTGVALRFGLHEGNPVVAPFINSYGLLPQVGVSALLCGVLWWYSKKGGAKLVYVLAALRWTVVMSNVFQLGEANHLIGLVHVAIH